MAAGQSSHRPINAFSSHTCRHPNGVALDTCLARLVTAVTGRIGGGIAAIRTADAGQLDRILELARVGRRYRPPTA